MKSSVEELDDNKVKVSVAIEAKEFDKAVDAAFKKIARDVRLPGFRKGKVPRKVLESHFGKGAARGQALQDSLPDYFLEAVNEHGVDIIAAPDYEIIDGEESGDVNFDAVVEVRPEINIAGYESLQVEIPRPAPSDEEVQEQIDAFLGQFAELESVDRPAIDGDQVSIDITGTYEGDDVEGLTATDYLYELGTGAVVAEIDENLGGAKVGDILEFDADHPDPDEDGELSFRVLVKDIQEKKLPELDDDVVKNASEFETADEFRTDLVTRMTAFKVQQVNSLLRERTAEALSRLVDIDAPEPLVESEMSQRLNDMAMRIQNQGIDFGQYLEATGQSVEQMHEQLREPAGESVKVDLALRAVVKAEQLDATDADVDEEFGRIAAELNTDVKKLRKQISSAGQIMAIRSDLEKRKAIDWLLERVTAVDEDGEPVDRADLEPVELEDHDHEHDHDHDHGDGESDASDDSDTAGDSETAGDSDTAETEDSEEPDSED